MTGPHYNTKLAAVTAERDELKERLLVAIDQMTCAGAIMLAEERYYASMSKWVAKQDCAGPTNLTLRDCGKCVPCKARKAK